MKDTIQVNKGCEFKEGEGMRFRAQAEAHRF